MGNNNSKTKTKSIQKHVEQSSETNSMPSFEEELKFYLSNNDNDDIDRQHLRHFIIKYLFKGNFSVPVEDKLTQGGCKVLDIACGPGTWLLELATVYEKSKFYGLDKKAIFPSEIKPSNLDFIERDIFDGLPFHDNEFDFTHVELMVYILTKEQWDYVFSELIRVTKPGGYIEITELHLNISDRCQILYKIYQGFNRSCLNRNVDIESIKNLDSILKSQPNIGNIHQIEKGFTFGPKGGKVGLVFQEILMSFISSKMAIKELSVEMGISEDEFTNKLNALKEELKGNNSARGQVLKFWTQKLLK